ncbi:MAG TPA: ABC transporter permease [Solirubrobacteraceae bacterium]|jgi:phospholipid/cholesterol/gamma-HCH transport system permease protein|nr:ABC transporter permease [Solirubrobacteraceae bacterium]
MLALRSGVQEVGDLAGFSVRAAKELRGTFRYGGEVLRQAGLLLVGSAFVLIAMELVIGGECGLFTAYVGRSFGASGAVGLFTLVCDVREMFPYMFGYILAAKVGCGLVAEIGSMRIAEEIDAMEVLGVPSMRYVVGTRLLASILVLPLVYVIAVAAGTLGSYLVVVLQVGDISSAAWLAGHFGPAHSLSTDLFSLIKAMAIGITIILVGTYYGYTASGGAVGVGAATARSMVVNLVMIHFIGGTLSLLFWGTNARLPIGG